MKLRNFLLGRTEFKSTNQIISEIKSFPRFEPGLEKLDDSEAMLVFKSEVQQAWLVFTNSRMYYVLDDIEDGKTTVEWARDKEKMLQDGRINLHMKEGFVSSRTGRITFDTTNHGFYFTKSLFPSQTLSGQISFMLDKHFLAT